MKFTVSWKLDKELEKIAKRDKSLAAKVEKQLILFRLDHLHPSLRNHKLSGKFKDVWSISIDKSIRMTYILDSQGATFIGIGTHDQIYEK